MRQWLLIIFLGLGLISMLACGALGAEPTTTAHGAANNAEGDAKHEEADSFPHPVISEGWEWAGAMVIIILVGFFLPAAVIGPIVRANTPEEVAARACA